MVIVLGVDIIISVCDLVLANSSCVTLSFSLSIHLSYIGIIVNVVCIGPDYINIVPYNDVCIAHNVRCVHWDSCCTLN